MIFHDLNHPDYNPSDCPTWAKERLPDYIRAFCGRNGLPPALRDEVGPLAPGVRGIDRYQANQFIVYREETASFLYLGYTPTIVSYRRGLFPVFEALAEELTKGCRTDLEKALVLLFQGGARLRHPSIPPCGPRISPGRNLDDESLLESGLAWCNEQARVFVRLCQVCNIPARIIQIFYADHKSGHCIAEFHAGGRWRMADASWLCVFPGPDGELLSAAECHDRGEGQRSCGLAYYRRQQELLSLPDRDLSVGGACSPSDWRKRVASETAGFLADKMGVFGVINYPLPSAPSCAGLSVPEIFNPNTNKSAVCD
jgi:hypothetical protein